MRRPRFCRGLVVFESSPTGASAARVGGVAAGFPTARGAMSRSTGRRPRTYRCRWIREGPRCRPAIRVTAGEITPASSTTDVVASLKFEQLHARAHSPGDVILRVGPSTIRQPRAHGRGSTAFRGLGYRRDWPDRARWAVDQCRRFGHWGSRDRRTAAWEDPHAGRGRRPRRRGRNR